MSTRSAIRTGALTVLAIGLLVAPSTAAAVSTVQSYSSLSEMPPGMRALFVGVIIIVLLSVTAGVWLSLRKAKSDARMVNDAMADVRGIIEAARVQADHNGPTVLLGGSPVIVGGQPVGTVAASAPLEDLFTAIKSSDPAFNEERFKGHVNEVFLAVKYAWAARDLGPVRRFLSDEQFSAANMKLRAEYISRGRVINLENLFVTGISPTDVSRQGEFDSVTVLIDGTAIVSTVDERTGKLLNPEVMGDGKTPRRIREAWTFLRKVGVVSNAEATTQQCPNCLAPVTDAVSTQCAYCGAVMNDPTLDWVVMRIEHVG